MRGRDGFVYALMVSCTSPLRPRRVSNRGPLARVGSSSSSGAISPDELVLVLRDFGITLREREMKQVEQHDNRYHDNRYHDNGYHGTRYHDTRYHVA